MADLVIPCNGNMERGMAKSALRGGSGESFMENRTTKLGFKAQWHGLIYTTSVKWIAGGKQPHSTGRSARCFVTT